MSSSTACDLQAENSTVVGPELQRTPLMTKRLFGAANMRQAVTSVHMP